MPLSIGKTVTQSRMLDHFDTLVIRDDINVLLIKSDENRIEITAGENIIDNITSKICDSILELSNDNVLNWIRTYDYRIDAKLYFKNICHITYSSSGTLKTENQFNNDTTYTPFQGDTLDFVPRYELFIDGSSGDIDMEFNDCDRLLIDYDYGTSNLRLHGNGNHTIEIFKKSLGSIDAKDFSSEHVVICNKSTRDCWINASKFLDARIENLGNIYYKGEPEKISESYGPDARGQLIKF